ncbi:MAG: heavy metal translocating P-type ATPase, partial [Christensenellaceae bacterium]
MAYEHGLDCNCPVCTEKREQPHSHGHEHGEGCSCQPHEDHGHSHEDGCGCGHDHAGIVKEGNGDKARLIAGIALFVAGILAKAVFHAPFGVELGIFLAAYFTLGFHVLTTAFKNIARGKVFDENFLMTIATIGAFILGDFLEGTAVMLFYMIGETLSDAAVQKSRKSITELMNIRPDYANLVRDGVSARVNPEQVKAGDIIEIKPYEKVPLDAVVTEGVSTLDLSALTGESLPKDIFEGSEVLAGSVNGSGLVRATVSKEYSESTAAKILDIVENAGSKKAQTEKFITKFSRYYTPIVCAGALLVGVIGSAVTGDINTWVYRALLFLVISCPCALVVSVPLSYFSGIGGASKKGILVKGANHLEALTTVEEVVFDKTGTLTQGTFDVKEIRTLGNHTQSEVIELAAASEWNSSHPIAQSIRRAYGGEVDSAEIKDYQDIPGYGVKAIYKGLPVLAGNAKLLEREGIPFEPSDYSGTLLYVARDGKMIGEIYIADTIKPDAKRAVKTLADYGIKSAMLTGDTQKIAENVAHDIGIDEYYSELLPQDKVSVLENI